MLNNPLRYTDPSGEIWHIVIGAAIGGIVNVALHWGQLNKPMDYFAAFGIGAVSGVIGAATGGTSFIAAGGAAAGAGGFLAGAFSGMISSAYATGIQSLGNSLVDQRL